MTESKELPEEIKQKIGEHLKQIADLEAQFNAYIAGVADANRVPLGWYFDKQTLSFYEPDPEAKVIE